MKIQIPPQVSGILNRLIENGREAYAVGGCVRDSLLGRKPNDWDIATSALPEETESIFSDMHIVKTGMSNGTVTVVTGGMPVEVTTYRVDGPYSDGRHPDSVSFTGNLKEDLARRDFTINALAYSEKKGLVDCFGGKEDLSHGIIRCVGDPDMRFHEDGLRILRALRFSSVLGFSVEVGTAESVEKNRKLLAGISKERIREEFTRLLCGQNAAEVLRRFREVIAEFIPEISPTFGFCQYNPHHVYDVWEHTLHCVDAVEPEPVLRLTMFLHDLGKPMCLTRGADGTGHFYGHTEKSAEIAQKIMTRLRYDKKTLQTVLTLVRSHDLPLWPDERCLRRRLNGLGEENLRLLVMVEQADAKGKANPENGYTVSLRQVSAVLDRILDQKQCFKLKDLAVKGDDLIKAGFPKGETVGNMLKVLLNAVIDGKCANTRQTLLHYAMKAEKGKS
ncbi:MAG TPA: tRNA nucleotidyltransferase [Ruminococcaceae bacterium]|jgi:tRNA nucleotidyltransferase (CCA-adding enzyme)|nr:tRNA nucleotidyltransferase [Oscillospiraceae bacterium]